MGIQIDLDSLKNSIDKVTANSMIPGLSKTNQKLIDKIDVTPKSGFSSEAVQIDYKVNYTIAATNKSAFDTIINLLRQGTGLASQDSLATVLNAADLTNKALSKILGVEKAVGEQQIDFTAKPKPGPGVKECYKVEMTVIGGSLISDITDGDADDELAKLTTTLNATGLGSKVLTKTNPETNATRVSINCPISVGPKSKKDDIRISAVLTQECRSDGDTTFLVLPKESVSLIQITRIRFVVSAVPCPIEIGAKVEQKDEKEAPKKDPETPKKDPETPKKDPETPKDKDESPKKEEDKNKSVGLRSIEGVGPAKELLLNKGGVNSIAELASYSGKGIDGISNTELTSYLIPFAKMLLVFNFDAESVEGIMLGLGATKVSEVVELAGEIKSAEQLVALFERSKVRMPASYNPSELFLKLQAIS